ncbi:hypothetical protein [Pseudokineococcus sp. 1T1Z-3]|uniref:hypothetical protein n=1 Tax=Pseudokineococcus sp. 1T1Z-3 TaxID=3132745 RepID=UPI0030979B8C
MSRRWPTARAVLGAVLAGVVVAGCTGPAPDDEAPDPAPTGAPTGGTPGTDATDGDAWSALQPDADGVAVGEPGPQLLGLGAKWQWGRADTYEPWLAQTGRVPSFVEAVWCELEPEEGRRDLARVERVMRRAQALDVDLLVKIRVGSCWATAGSAEHVRGAGKTESDPPADVAAYENFVTELVEAGAGLGVTSWAVENEVNAPAFWSGTAAEYEEHARTTAAAVRAADPTARVLDSGLSSVAHGYGVVAHALETGGPQAGVAAWNAYYAARIGTRGTLPRVGDAAELEAVLAGEPAQVSLAQWEVASRLAADGVLDARQVHFYEPQEQLGPLFAALRASTPASVPLEVWELGDFWRDGEGVEPAADERDADLLRASATVLAEGSPVAVWLPLAVNPDGRNADEPRWGLVGPDGSDRGATEAYLRLSRAAPGARAVPFVVGDVRGTALVGASGTTAVAWSTGAPQPTAAGVDGPGEVGTTPVVLGVDGGVEELVEALR